MEENVVMDPAVPYRSLSNYDIYSLVEMVRRGINYGLFNRFAGNTTFTTSDWSSFLHLSERTLLRYQTEQKTFDSLQSEKILEIALFYKKGEAVFGDPNKFNTWLETENLALGRRVPKSLLDSSFGISVLKDELGRIEHGIFS